MTVRQWDIWKHPALGADHWYVLISGQERCAAPQAGQLNGLICFSLRGRAASTDVVLDQADGFQRPTVCQCDLFFPIKRADLRDRIGEVSHFRRQAIIRKLIEVFRLIPS
jgi:hypothetical protein